MKIAILGCGMISDTHIKEIKKIPDADLVSVCDQEYMMAQQLAERHGIPYFYTDLMEMIAKRKPDVVHVLTPPTTHFKICQSILEAGCHVLVEKPFTLNYDEAHQVIKCAIKNNKKLTVNHFHNFSPPALKVKQLLAEGVIGEVIHLESFYSYNMESPALSALRREGNSWLYSLPGGVFQNNISHLIYKIVELMPNGDIQAHALGYTYQGQTMPGSDNTFSDELRVMMTNGKISAYATFSSNIIPFRQFLIIYGEKQTILADYETRTVILWPKNGWPGPFGKLSAPMMLSGRYCSEGIKNIIKFAKFDYHFYAGMHTLLKRFYGCIQNQEPLPIQYDEILRIALVMDIIFKQINTSTAEYGTQDGNNCVI